MKAPSSAFVVVRVASPNRGIQKMAKGERNWYNDAWEWAQAIEDGAGGPSDHNIIDHNDVTAATGPDLEAMTQGGYAIDPDAANPLNDEGFRPLHKHYGSTINAGTDLARGTVKVEEVLVVGDPVALVKEVNQLVGTASHSKDAGGFISRIDPQGEGYVIGSEMCPVHILWRVFGTISLTQWSAQILSVPRLSGGGAYEIRLVTFANESDLMTNTFAVVAASTITLPEAIADGGPVTDDCVFAPAVVIDDTFLGVQVHAAPTTLAERGEFLNATVEYERIPA